MTCDNFLSTLRLNLQKILVFGENKSYFMGIFESLGPTCKPYDYKFERTNFKYKNRQGTKIDHLKYTKS